MPLAYPNAETTPTIKGITRANLMKRILQESGLGEYGVVTSGDTNYFIDTTKLKSSQYSDREYVDGWIRGAYDASSADSALENYVAPITTYDPTTGQISFNPSASVAFAAGDFYEIWKFPNPKLVVDIIDKCLKNDVFLPYWSVLSDIPDFDMEQSHTTDWGSSSATVTKQTSNPINGLRYLRVVSTATDGYARSQLMNVEPSQNYHTSAIVRCGSSSTTATLIAYDETNGAVIDSKSITRLQPVRLWFDFTTPATCYQISIRLANEETTVTTEWDDVVLYSPNSKMVSLPWWVEDADYVKAVFRLSTQDLGTGISYPDMGGDLDKGWSVVDNSFGRGKLALRTRLGNLSSPLYIFGVRNETAYSTDTTDTKLVDEDYLVSCVLYNLFKALKSTPREGYLDSKFFQAKYEEWERNWEKESYKLQQRINSVVPPAGSYSSYSHPLDSVGW